jgi:hypothetical protein
MSDKGRPSSLQPGRPFLMFSTAAAWQFLQTGTQSSSSPRPAKVLSVPGPCCWFGAHDTNIFPTQWSLTGISHSCPVPWVSALRTCAGSTHSAEDWHFDCLFAASLLGSLSLLPIVVYLQQNDIDGLSILHTRHSLEVRPRMQMVWLPYEVPTLSGILLATST